MTAAFKEYTGWSMKKSKKISIRKKLSKVKERQAQQRERQKTKRKERDTCTIKKKKQKRENPFQKVWKKLWQDISGTLSEVDRKKLFLTNLPYVFVFYAVNKLAWLYRYCQGNWPRARTIRVFW